jgi:hypothetical protein
LTTLLSEPNILSASVVITFAQAGQSGRRLTKEVNVTTRNVIWVVAVALALSVSINAQTNCSIGVASGTYIYSGDGWVATAPGTIAPTSAIGLLTIDADGIATGTYTQSIAGTITTGEIKGSMTIAPDCTGTLQYTLEYSSASYEMKLVFAAQTGDIHALFSKTPTQATTMICKFTRIARLMGPTSEPVEEAAAAAKRQH